MTVKYPVFFQCMQYTCDEFWIIKYKRLSRGEQEPFCKYKNELIYIGDQVINTTHPSKLLWVKVIDAFHRVGVYSHVETSYNESLEEYKNASKWTHIKSKNIKDIMLRQFASTADKITKFKLTKYLQGSPDIKIKKVHLEEGKITKVEFKESDSDTQEKSKPEIGITLTSLCIKFIKEEQKTYQKYNLQM